MQTFFDVWTYVYTQEFYKALYIVGIVVCVMMIESVIPVRKSLSYQGRVRNVIYGIIYILCGAGLMAFVLYGVQFFMGVAFDSHETIVEAIVTSVVYLFLIDHSFYWYHRLEHRWATLWTVHELHHAEDEMNVLTGMRTYFLEKPLQYIVISLPIIFVSQYVPALQLGEMSGSILALATIIGLYFSHANARVGFGFLNGFVVSPQVHRIHHSLKKEHFDKNFAQFFSVIDVIYGTYYKPQKNEYPETGTINLAADASVGSVLIRPLRKWMGSE